MSLNAPTGGVRIANAPVSDTAVSDTAKPATTVQDSEQTRLSQLKELLFQEEMEQVKVLEQNLQDDQRLADQMRPILEKRIAELEAEFPEQFGPVITETLKVQIKESQDTVVEAIYPIMGKLIKKYIQKEIAKLSESIDIRMRQMFSFKGLWQRLKYGSKGVSQSEVIVQGLLPPVLEEIMVIENDSGLLMAHYSVGNESDADVVAGMLTAIKSFVEDAYAKSNQDLEFIEYETFTLYLQSFKSFYIVVAISGVLNQEFRDKLNDAVLGFAVKIAEDKALKVDQVEMQHLLEHHFQQVNR